MNKTNEEINVKDNTGHVLAEHFTEEDESEKTRLTLKQKMKILARKDCMGKMKPTWRRVLIAAAVVFCLLAIIGKVQLASWNSGEVNAIAVEADEVQLTFVGDMSFANSVQTYGEKRSYTGLFYDAKRLWANSDFVFANLESAIIRQDANYKEANKERLSGSQTALKVASECGVNVVSVANDHASDYGRTGLKHMLMALDKYGIAYAGAGANSAEAASYQLLQQDGLTVGYVACTSVVPEGSAATANNYGVQAAWRSSTFTSIREAEENSDFVVAYVHWGKEDAAVVTEHQEELAHQLIDAGADIVIGSHPHVLQPIEQYKGGVIFYSLGNFIYDAANRDSRNSAMLQLNVDVTTGEGTFTLIPLRINNFHACVTDSGFYLRQIQNRLTERMGDSAYTIDEENRIVFSKQIYAPAEEEIGLVDTELDTDGES